MNPPNYKLKKHTIDVSSDTSPKLFVGTTGTNLGQVTVYEDVIDKTGEVSYSLRVSEIQLGKGKDLTVNDIDDLILVCGYFATKKS